MKQFNTSRFLTPMALAFALAASGAAVAEEQGGGAQGGMQQQQAPNISVSEQQVESFAEAQARVAEISEKWTPRMQEAESSEAEQKAREQAQQEMVDAVKNAGLSVQAYNQIARAAQTDAQLRQQIQNAQ